MSTMPCVRLVLASVALATIACATNPVTGQRQLSLVSEAQEIEMGRDAAREAEASLGLVDDQELQAYVKRVGMVMARKSERPNLPWNFAVVDDPTPNAFALPGGFIYVTRGLIGLMDSEAELASVLGHEIGHVTARHSVSMMSRAQLAQLGLGLGSVLLPDLQPAAVAAGAGLELLFLRYGRDAERQADDLGFRYARTQGYDMTEMADVFAALERAATLEKQSPLPTWLASHPSPGERITAVKTRIAAAGPQQTPRVARAEYLREIDGLVFGDNPRNGFFRGNVFYHPDLRFRLDMPSGWQYGNFARAVTASSKDGAAAFQLSLVADMAPAQAAQRFLSQRGIVSRGSERDSINGLSAVVSHFVAETEQGNVQGHVAYLEYGGQTYQLLAFATTNAFGRYQNALARSIRSFSRVTDQNVLNVRPERIDIVQLSRSLSLERFNSENPSTVPLPTLALLNQVTQPSAPLESGRLIKRVVRQS
jgi:predicted Zn-dependent protease